MNYIKHLSGFFVKVSSDDRLNPTHISLYISLFQFWNTYRFHNPISISRQDAMKVSKISSKVTYHKCIRELHNFGYLRYEPSYNPFKGSLVYLFDFQTNSELVNKMNPIKNGTGSEQVANTCRTKIETGTGQALIPYINNTNNSKQQTEVNELFKFNSDENNTSSKNDSTQLRDSKEKLKGFAGGEKKENSGRQKKVANKKEKACSETFSSDDQGERFQRPLREKVKEYFAEHNWPAKEADKFYNHYESNGWLVGGKTPMFNWIASAGNWMLNSENFNNDKNYAAKNLNSIGFEKRTRSGNLHTSTGKDYGEPL